MISVDAGNEADQYLMCSSNPYLAGRRRRMSLLQTLRYQNKQLTDSAFDSPRSVGNKSERVQQCLGLELENYPECHNLDTINHISPTGGDLLSHHSRRSAIESPPSSQFQEELILNKSSNSPSALSFSKLKAKTKALFGKRSVSEKKSLVIERRYTASDAHGRCYPTDSLERSMYSRIDFSAKGEFSFNQLNLFGCPCVE
ncbi:unnamed protein product [Anisakis simplex]|uniref:Uncharacterized protein n=1 Tax=Anisakis simplex TaxID=6269 RepID=A0A0M3J0P2_ANISI|nr:unnamed protein product [Anisakis simplex]